MLMLLSLSTVAASVDMQHIRDLFARSNVDEAANEKLIDLTENYSMLSNPVLYAYHAGGIMARANHTIWPTSKLDYFNEGKELLERVVKRFPDNVEIRFVRFNVQQGAPGFLDYSDDMTADKKIILAGMDKLDWSASYKKEIREYLNSN